MRCSINEIQSLASKAARGAGAPAGQADLFGKAAACHLASNRAEADIENALDQLPDGPILDCPIKSLSQADAGSDLEQSYRDPPPKSARLDISDDLFRILRRSAQKTYVPATDASRAGAGAGLTDND